MKVVVDETYTCYEGGAMDRQLADLAASSGGFSRRDAERPVRDQLPAPAILVLALPKQRGVVLQVAAEMLFGVRLLASFERAALSRLS